MSVRSVIVSVAALLSVAFAWGGAIVPELGLDAAANRVAIQRAVDEVCAQGGGRVEIPPGTWTTGSIQLKDGVELHLPKGATLKGSVNRRDYNANDAFPDNKWSDGEEWSGGHVVWAWCAHDIAITGEGTIDGNGPAFFGEADFDSWFPNYKYGLKLHPIDREWFRPGIMVAFFRCRNVRLSDVSLVNTPAWTCHLRCCDGVDIRGVKIAADVTIANSDGFSIDCSRNVKVEDCRLRCGDDGFAIRASCQAHAETNFCENIEIRNCDISSCCYGIRIGIGSGTIRNVRVENSRILEAATAGVGLTPAWIDVGRNCYIEDVTLKDCLIEECMRSVEGWTPGDSKAVGIRFENCVFKTLLPSVLQGSERLQVSFVNCERRGIEKFKVRHRLGWNEAEIRDKRLKFGEFGGDLSKIRVENCRPRPFGSYGVLLLTFDDRNFEDWERAMPLFEKYGAHATFFMSGELTTDAIRTTKKLSAAGHSIGLHGRTHADVPETVAAKGWEAYWASEVESVWSRCNVAYIPVRNFAYPNNRHTSATDELILKKLMRVRVGIPGVRPYDPKGEKRAELKPLVTDDRVFFPVADLPSRRVLGGVILGEAYNTDIADVVACVKRAGERKEALVLTSHGIHPDAKDIHLKTEWLERILAAAQEAGVAVLGFEELPFH